MAILNVVNIKKKLFLKDLWMINYTEQNACFPLTASFPSSSYVFANFSSISHMRSIKIPVCIFLHKLVLT